MMTNPNHDQPYGLEDALEATVAVLDATALETMFGAEVDRQISDARENRRELRKFQDSLKTLATLDRETAETCTYSIPRGGRRIEGPSIRFAEMVHYAWSNLRVSTTVLSVDDKAAIVRGTAHDMETNNVLAMDVRRVVNKKKKNTRPDEDDKQIAISVATSLARRNAILSSVPKSLWMPGLRASQKAAQGNGTMEELRPRAIKAYVDRGATEEKVLAALGRKGVEEITSGDLRHLRGMLSAIIEGNLTMDAAMATPDADPPRGKSGIGASALSAKMAQPAPAQAVTPHDPETGEVHEYETALPDGESEAAP